MKKSSFILVGFIFILLLTFVAFSSVSKRIKEDLLAQAQTKFYEKGINDIQAELKGEGITFSRTLILTGNVYSEKTKADIGAIMQEIRGVYSIENKIVVTSPSYYQPILDKDGRVPGIPPLEFVEESVTKPTTLPVQSPKSLTPLQTVDTSTPKHTDSLKEPQALEQPSTPKVVEVVTETQETSSVPKVLQAPDMSHIKVATPTSTIEIPKAIEVETVYEERETFKKGEE